MVYRRVLRAGVRGDSTAATGRQDALPPGCARRPRAADRRHPGPGRRAQLRREQLQPRGAGAAAAGQRLQADRGRAGPPPGLHTELDPAGLAGLLSLGRPDLVAPELRPQVPRTGDPALHAAEVDQRPDDPAARRGRGRATSWRWRNGWASPATSPRSFPSPSAPRRSRPLEITSAYGSFANRGIRVEPYAIDEVEDRSGRVLLEHQPVSHEVLDERNSFTHDQPAALRHRPRHRLPGAREVRLRRAGRRQDRHHRRLQRRLVRRLHPPSRLRRLGRLRRPEVDRLTHDRAPRRRFPPGAAS